MQFLWLLLVLAAAAGLGYKVISDVPSLLHTPLMSGMNALSGITVVGALLAAGTAVYTGNVIIGMAAVVLAAVNVAGGFVVTHRMLKMFHGGRGGRR